jgi:predicted Rossmann fold nucleotide-binding protein DprA/Smf involved in DNA uptake
VGSRDVREDGLAFSAAVGRRAAKEGLGVVSGAARGVDINAMLAAVDAGGSAVGVLADSLERFVARRELREPILENSLALITSYHPAAGFNVGHAMRRNRLIYGLAEVAVVVASTLEKGGTRAGAIENLDARWVPMYVRDDGSAGNTDLIRRGARRLDSDAFDRDMPFPLDPTQDASTELQIGFNSGDEMPPDVTHPSTDAPVASATTAALPPDASGRLPAGSPPTDLFPLVWPQLATFLFEARSEKDVAEAFHLETSQARAWLKRAVEEGFAERLGSKRRYITSYASRQSALFGDA